MNFEFESDHYGNMDFTTTKLTKSPIDLSVSMLYFWRSLRFQLQSIPTDISLSKLTMFKSIFSRYFEWIVELISENSLKHSFKRRRPLSKTISKNLLEIIVFFIFISKKGYQSMLSLRSNENSVKRRPGNCTFTKVLDWVFSHAICCSRAALRFFICFIFPTCTQQLVTNGTIINTVMFMYHF